MFILQASIATGSAKIADDSRDNGRTLLKVTERLQTTTNNTMEFYIVVIVTVTDWQHKLMKLKQNNLVCMNGVAPGSL